MAGKRNASNELTHDNWDDEYEHEDAGTFKRATDEVIRNRVIKTARRRNPISSNNDSPKNVFSGFDGFKKPDINQQKNPSPFASLISKSENISNSFGLFKNITSSKVSNTPSNTGSVSSPFKIPEVPSAINNNKEKTDSPEKDTNYYAKLKGLNESVLDWIKTHVEKNPFIILTPVFEDYNKHLSKIENENGSVKTFSETSIGYKQIISPNKSSTHSASIFGNLSSKSSDSNILSSTSLEEQKDATSIAFSPSATTTTSFSFGSNQKSASPSATGFSFGSGTPFTFTNVSKVDSGPDNPLPASEQKDAHIEDEDEPPKVEFTPVVEDGNIFQKRCKIFIKKNNQFSDRGVGQLFLKPVEGSEKIQLIARADTSLGNLLLNFILNTSIPMQRMGKNNVMLVSIPTPECKPPPVPILLRVKTSEEADDLLKVLQKYRK